MSGSDKVLCEVFSNGTEIVRAIMGKQVTTIFTTDGYARTYSTSKKQYTHYCRVSVSPNSHIYT